MAKSTGRDWIVAALTALATGGLATSGLAEAGQTLPAAVSAPSGSPAAVQPAQPLLPDIQPLLDFKESEIKFPLESLMEILRDKSHEGWVLAAYPDPNTSRPLIGAGFSLDVQAADHPQRDPFNSKPFLEPSSAQLWQAAGLDQERLERILEQFDRNLERWSEKGYRRRIRRHTLTPELTEEEATRLLHISAIQSIENARAYCRNFDQLTASQQMALSQLVFQMGVNLRQFVDFLSLLNGDDGLISWLQSGESNRIHISQTQASKEQWQTVQDTLIDSQWARRYSRRAGTVIAMFDPDYARDPAGKVEEIEATLHPPVEHHRKPPPKASLRAAYHSNHPGKPPGKKHISPKTERS